MSDSINFFQTNELKKLTRNPLGIIGLFISLIYGFACLVLSTSISNLSSKVERLPLIWFIIVFPIIILGAFIYLVVNHHEKLYAPSDFRDDNSFIEALSGRKIREKQAKEVELLETAESENLLESNNESNATIEEKQVDSLSETSTNQIEEPLNKTEIAERLKNSEKWAILDLELKYNTSFKTNQRVVSNGIHFEFDAFSNTQSKVIVAEVKYWQSNKAIKPLLHSIQEFMLRLDRIKKAFGKKPIEMVVVIVFDKIIDKNVDNIRTFISDLNNEVKFEIKDYTKLYTDYKE